MTSLAFPDNMNFPSIFSQFAQISFIYGNITLAFCLPEFGIYRMFDFAITAFVHIPKTAVDEDKYVFLCIVLIISWRPGRLIPNDRADWSRKRFLENVDIICP